LLAEPKSARGREGEKEKGPPKFTVNPQPLGVQALPGPVPQQTMWRWGLGGDRVPAARAPS